MNVYLNIQILPETHQHASLWKKISALYNFIETCLELLVILLSIVTWNQLIDQIEYYFDDIDREHAS